MKVIQLSEMVRGWLIGDFEPSVLRTKEFEVGITRHAKGEYWPPHYHSKIYEVNILVEGKIKFADTIIEEESIFIFEPGEVAAPEFLEDCKIVCIKVPSIVGDKHLV